MKRKWNSCRAVVVAIVLAASPCVIAEGPSSTRVPARPCVLLTNDNVLFGHAQQVGQYVIVRRESGGELQLPRHQVACWAGDVMDLYRYRVDHRHTSGLDAHLTDAQWCVRNDLLEIAEQELAAARAIDPNSRTIVAIERQIASARVALMRQPSPDTSASDPAASGRVSEEIAVADDISSDVDPITLRFFGSVVQPMLINRCGNCHSHETDRDWTMINPGSTSRPSSRMTRENLMQTLAFIDRDSPEDSDLIVKATSPHGGAPPMLDTRHARSIEALKAWLHAVAAETAFVPTPPPDVELASATLEAPIVWGGPEIPGTPGTQWPAPVQPLVTESPASVPVPVQTPTTPKRLPPLADPFSPDLFNRLRSRQ